MRRETYEVDLLTPCFCAGALQNQPEIRIPSIRGHLRDWHELLRDLGPVEDTWGGVKGEPKASKITLRLLDSPPPGGSHAILPHKSERCGWRKAIDAEQSFLIEMISRDAAGFGRAERALNAWCLLGCLGYRANRAAGSVWRREWDFSDDVSFAKELGEIGLQKLDVWISETCFDNAASLRKTASDTLSMPDIFGRINPRTPSPVRMKAVRVGGALRLVLWAPTKMVGQAVQALAGKRCWQAAKMAPLVV